ncbi:MAG: substrate-binding domain-containing protein, partial [SAR324 cluster bacterium]|nr:substrate-binding domain-containing protein [SAR324 cluster bacterium]
MFRKTIATLATGLAALMMAGMAHARDQIQIVGSSTVYPFATVVAEKHGQRGSMKTPVIESTGTGGGMKLFCGGLGPSHPDFTDASRAIKGSEKELCAKNGGTELIEIIVGNDGIAYANSAKSQKMNVTQEQLSKAMAEHGPKPKMWNEIDASLPNQP